MGAWGYCSFENDDALDWVADLESSSNLSEIETALNGVNETSEEFLDSRECSKAIAAAEVIAALHGFPSPELPDEVLTWIENKPKPDSTLNQKARQAINAILSDSELRELWEENTEDYPKWVEVLERIKVRLP